LGHRLKLLHSLASVFADINISMGIHGDAVRLVELT
jgi:hypothetical protein